MILASSALPDNAGYVVAAYLVFLALLLVYFVIMAYKLTKIQRDVLEIDELVQARDAAEAASGSSRQEIRA